MPAEIVNLNKFRKAKERAEQERQAQENRAKYGRTKLERSADAEDQARRDALLDGVKLTAAEPNTGGHGERDPNQDPGAAS